jgi:hypothetical protein
MTSVALRTLTFAVSFFLCSSAFADVEWTLNATFTDGMTATGTFLTSGGSASTDPTFISWDVVFAGGTASHDFVDSNLTNPSGAIGVEFPPNPWWPTSTSEELGLAHDPGYAPYDDFYLGGILTDAGGTISLIGAYSCGGSDTCYSLAGTDNSLVGVNVPEPPVAESLACMACSLAFGLIVVRSRRLKAAND